MKSVFAAMLLACSTACNAEQPVAASPGAEQARALRPVPGCEGCEAAWERDAATLGSRISLAPHGEPGAKLILRGTVYRAGSRIPAAGVVLYVHHTNAAGRYAGGSGESEWSRRHGRLRGWLKTGSDGRYEIETVKAGPYPDRDDPAHIHVTVLEPGKDPYWIDDVVFEDDARVDRAYRAGLQNRGGSGIVRLVRQAGGGWLAERDIVLLP